MEQIRNPKSHKADARMPAFEAIKDEDLRALAEYLASLK
jgi:cytochrome c1